MKKELLHNYLNNKCKTNSEFDDFAYWITQKTLGVDDKKLIYNDWKEFDNYEENKEYYNLLLDKIHHKINVNTTKGKKVTLWQNIFKWSSRVAAILFIPLLVFSVSIIIDKNNNIYLVNSVVDTLKVVAPLGSRTSITLSDGTVVYLNYGSELKYPRLFNNKKRIVSLKGEAYFKVAHNSKIPFIVKAKNINVVATGTQFNVNAYSEHKLVTTTLVEGKVYLSKTLSSGKNKDITSLKPGQHCIYYSNSGKYFTSKADVDKYIAWKDGKLIFDNEPISVLAKKLSRIYNVDIIITEDVKYLTYTVVFVDEHLFQILDLMKLTTPIKYKALPRKKMKNGTYSKQKIIISKR